MLVSRLGNKSITRVVSISFDQKFLEGIKPQQFFLNRSVAWLYTDGSFKPPNAAFPNGEYDDLVDSMTQALMRYRQGNFVSLPTDDWDIDEDKHTQVRAYYG